MEDPVAVFAEQGMADSTRQSYATGWTRYVKRHRDRAGPCLPVTQPALCSFAAHLGQQNLVVATIRLHLAGITSDHGRGLGSQMGDNAKTAAGPQGHPERTGRGRPDEVGQVTSDTRAA